MIIAHDESYSINQSLVHVNMISNLLINLFIFDTLDIKWFVTVPCLFNVVKEFSAKKITGTLSEGGNWKKNKCVLIINFERNSLGRSRRTRTY